MESQSQKAVDLKSRFRFLLEDGWRGGLKSQLSSGVFWTVLGTACSRGGTFLISFLLARELGRSAFGELGVIECSIAMFAAFGNVGLSLTATKFVAKHRVSDPAKAGRILGLCLSLAILAGACIAAAAFLLAPWLASTQLAAPHLTEHLRWAAGVVFLTIFNATLTGGLIGFQAFQSMGTINLVTALVSMPVTTAAGCWWGLSGVIGGFFMTQLILCGLSVYVLARKAKEHHFSLSYRHCWDERSVLASVSLPALLNGSLSFPVNWLCVAMLVNAPNGYMEMGILNVVNVWFLMLLFLPGQLSQVYYPMIENSLAGGDLATARSLVGKAVALNVLICSAIACGVTLFADQILLAYGQQYLGAKAVLIVTAWTACLSGIQQPFAVYLVARSRMWLVFCCSAAWALACYGISSLLIDWGATGIATARFAGYLLYACISIWFGLGLLRPPMRERTTYHHLSPGEQILPLLHKHRGTERGNAA